MGSLMVEAVLRLVSCPRRTAELIGTLHSLMLPLPAAPGFISSRVFVESDNPDALCYVEEWRTVEDLNREMRSSHYTRLLAVMEEASERPELQFRWVTDVKGLDYLETVRRCDAPPDSTRSSDDHN